MSSDLSYGPAGSAPHEALFFGPTFGAVVAEEQLIGPDALDELLNEAESENAAGLAEARKWVADTFYADGQSLASLRLRLGLSQQQLAERCGMSQSNISRYEAGGARPTDRCARLLQEALRLPHLDDVYSAYDASCSQASKGED